MLQNLLKVRYADAPVFLDVTSVISSYTRSAGANVGGQYANVNHGDAFGTLGGNVGYEDKPTITYTPLSGEKFSRSLMAPLPISGILYLFEAAYPAGAVLRVAVKSINTLENASGSRANPNPGDPKFAELARAIHEAQTASALGVRQKTPKDRESAVMLFNTAAPAGADALCKVRGLLGLDPTATEFEVVYGSLPSHKREIAILTRSTLQILVEFASRIDVPAADVAEGRVYAPARTPEQARLFPPILKVRSGATPPADAYVAMRYRNGWFWIDDRDERSKVGLNFLMFIFALTESGKPDVGAPVVTIPAR